MLKYLPVVLILSVAVFGCRPSVPLSADWDGSLQIGADHSIPFRVHLDLGGIQPSGYFLVSDERTAVPIVQMHGDSIRLVITGYDAEMGGVWNGSQWIGSYLRIRKDTTAIPFVAVPAHEESEEVQAQAEAPSGVRLTGNFLVLLETKDGIDSSMTATFWTKGDSAYGTFIDPSGDYGLMVGTQSGAKATLSRFTGWQANLMELQQNEDRWVGKFYSRNLPPQSFTLVPRPSGQVTLPEAQPTRMKNPRKPFVFRGLSIDGDTVRSTDPAFRNKVLVVDIMGTWCHNCMDAAPLLNQISADFKDRGVVVVGLSFEIRDDPEQGRKNLASYRDRYRIDFPLLYCGSTQGEGVATILRSQLENFGAYPTTLFIDRRGIVNQIHIGFLGPGTGNGYLSQVQEYFGIVRKLAE